MIVNLDHAASGFGYNPSSIHKGGQTAKSRITFAKQDIANVLGCSPDELFFTSGGSESNNWAIKGVAYANQDKGKHIITTQIEHPSVLESCRFLERQGFRVTYLPVNPGGYIQPEAFYQAVDQDTILISIGTLNHELGTYQSLAPYQVYAKSHGVLFHSDCVQAAAYHLPMCINTMVFADLVSISGHKFGAPKGIGILYIKGGTKIDPLIHGGHQQFGLRAGTEPDQLILNLATSLDASFVDEQYALIQMSHVRSMRDKMYQYIMSELPNTKLNGANLESRAANNLNLCFPGIDGEAFTLALSGRGVYVSRGSACSSGEYTPSYVLKAIGMSDEDAMNSIRITIPPYITEEEAEFAAEQIVDCAKVFHRMSARSSIA